MAPSTASSSKEEGPQKKKKKTFRFLDLPAELRNRIHELALTRSRNLRIITAHFGQGPRLNNTRIFPSILLANHQTHAEATPILYGDNTFGFLRPDALHLFLQTIGPAAIKHLRHVEVKMFWTHSGEELELLKYAEKLQTLVVEDCYCSAKALAKGLRGLHEEREKDDEAEKVMQVVKVLSRSAKFMEKVRGLLVG